VIAPDATCSLGKYRTGSVVATARATSDSLGVRDQHGGQIAEVLPAGQARVGEPVVAVDGSPVEDAQDVAMQLYAGAKVLCPLWRVEFGERRTIAGRDVVAQQDQGGPRGAVTLD
jgi:hypothetical protein